MLHKFNLSALNDYSQRFARKVCDDFFAQNTTASGQQILNLTEIPQINLFAISSLYEKWRADAENFRSPYFDFEQEEVKEALKQFMNVVSRNIAVKREVLEPILFEAIKDTLVLLIDPSSYFNELFRNQENFSVTAELVQQLCKYVRFNKFIPQELAKGMKDRSFVYVNQAIEWSEQALQLHADELDSVEQWVGHFSAKVPLDISHLVKKTMRVELLKVIDEPNRSFFDTVVPEPEPEYTPAVVAAPEPTPAPEPAVPSDSAWKQEPVSYTPPAPANPTPATLNQVVGGSENGVKESLNDYLRVEQSSISDVYQKQAITSIAQSIPLNQKFMFIHHLFSGSNSAYETAIAELEQAPDYDTARSLITYKFASQYLWDMTGDVVGDLLEIVKRRFRQ
jgi:hypothetical protein